MKIGFAAVIIFASSIGWAAPPSENLVKGCLQARSVAPSVTIRKITVEEAFQEGGYANGFNAIYIFKYKYVDMGYAQGKRDQALIYSGKIYRLSKSTPIGNNVEVKSTAFNPMLAQWSLAKEKNVDIFVLALILMDLDRAAHFKIYTEAIS
ncbi:hypothetical protein bAD24_I04210 [Burkholderia sp. AD24]|nr:hypothetical protein bAD24_I04210 [Burkholderia sp. AD24]